MQPEFERLFGASENEIVGKTDYDFVDRQLADFFRDHDHAAMVADRLALRNEEWLNFAAGGYRGLFETTKSPMHDSDGTIIGVLGVSRDISERKRIENELAQSQQQLERQVAERTAELQRKSRKPRRSSPWIAPVSASIGLKPTADASSTPTSTPRA